MITLLASMVSTIDPPAMLPLALVDLPIAPPPTPILIKGEVALPIAQAPSSLNGDSGPSEKVPMEVKNITTLPHETLMVEAIVPLERFQ